MDYDIDEAIKDWEEFKREALGAITVSALAGFIIVCILSWYRNTPDVTSEK